MRDALHKLSDLGASPTNRWGWAEAVQENFFQGHLFPHGLFVVSFYEFGSLLGANETLTGTFLHYRIQNEACHLEFRVHEDAPRTSELILIVVLNQCHNFLHGPMRILASIALSHTWKEVGETIVQFVSSRSFILGLWTLCSGYPTPLSTSLTNS